jgi:hypothetical protein
LVVEALLLYFPGVADVGWSRLGSPPRVALMDPVKALFDWSDDKLTDDRNADRCDRRP